MQTPRLPQRFNRAVFDALLVHESEPIGRVGFEFLQREEEELDRLAENAFKTNYDEEYQKACAQAEEAWYPYRAANIFDEQQIGMYQDSEIGSLLQTRWSELQQQVRTQYINAMLPEVKKAVDRRAKSETRYETEWGFRVKSKGEQAIANALRFFTTTDPNTFECKRITLLYEP